MRSRDELGIQPQPYHNQDPRQVLRVWQEPRLWRFNRLAIEHVWKHTARYYGGMLGITLYIIDTEAKGDRRSIVGADWQKGYSRETGEIETFCGCLAPAPAHNLEHAHILEDEIKRQGTQEPYAIELARVVGITPIGDFMLAAGPLDMFRLAHATAEQRTRAALLTYGVNLEDDTA